MCKTLVFLLMLQIGGILCRSSGNLTSDKYQRIQKTMEIVWPHVDWNVEPCTNFGHFSCKDNKDSSRMVECVDDTSDFKVSTFANKHRQKRQFLEASHIEVDKRTDTKLMEIYNNPNMQVEPGVRKMAEIFANIAEKDRSGSPVSYDEEWLKILARLSVCHLMDEYSENKKFFEDLIPRFREVAVEIGARAFSKRDKIYYLMQDLTINFGFGDFDLPSKLTELLEGLSPTENYKDTIEKIVSYKFEYLPILETMEELTEQNHINAYYAKSLHSLNLGPFFLISPTFRTDFMYSHIFGGVLATFFHELGHSISMNFASLENFKICVINEVENMSLTVECPNERVKLVGKQPEEILADKLGLAMAWHMYNKYYKHLDKENFSIKDRKFSREQIFFISFGLNLCFDKTDKWGLGNRISIKKGHVGHPNSRNRKNLAVKTISTFFDEFQCARKDIDYTRCSLFELE